MTTSERLAQLRAEKGDTPLLAAPAPTTAQVGVGWSVWERSPDGTSYTPRGGVVVHIDPASTPDPETGEMLDRFLVVRARAGGLHWVSLRADQLAAVDDGCRPNAHTIAGVCQVVQRELREQLERRRGVVDHERVLELFSLGARLMAVVARPASELPA